MTLYVISFKEGLPEDGQNSWSKHVGRCAFYSTINLRICIWTCWSYIS